MKKVTLITDGGCIGNPGPGGWAAILRSDARKREMYGCSPHTTNNRMELTAAIQGLRALKESCEVEIVTECSCPVGVDCKHAVALALAWLARRRPVMPAQPLAPFSAPASGGPAVVPPSASPWARWAASDAPAPVAREDADVLPEALTFDIADIEAHLPRLE